MEAAVGAATPNVPIILPCSFATPFTVLPTRLSNGSASPANLFHCFSLNPAMYLLKGDLPPFTVFIMVSYLLPNFVIKDKTAPCKIPYSCASSEDAPSDIFLLYAAS